MFRRFGRNRYHLLHGDNVVLVNATEIRRRKYVHYRAVSRILTNQRYGRGKQSSQLGKRPFSGPQPG